MDLKFTGFGQNILTILIKIQPANASNLPVYRTSPPIEENRIG